jgi:outer membrane lipoprotein-sorting protein
VLDALVVAVDLTGKVFGMKKSLLLLLASAVLTISQALPVQAQTADEVIERHLAASGGRAALSKITSRVATGTISLTTPGGDVEGSIELYNKAPNKSRTLIKIDLRNLGLGQVVQDQRFDGISGYAIDSLNGNRDITGDQLEITKAGRFPSPLLDYKSAGVKVELIGKEKVDGHDAYVLKLSPAAGPMPRVYIDAESYLIVRTVVTLNVPQLGTDVEQTVDMSDYRDVDGVKVAFHTRSANQLQTITITFTKVEQNIPIDDAMFSKPAQ